MNTTLTQNELACWLALLRTPSIGPAKFARILKISPNLCDFFNNGRYKRLDLPLSELSLNYLANPDWHIIEQELRWAETANQHIITWGDQRYPALLKEIPSPPPILYVHGQIECLHDRQLAIVGSRNPTHSGKENAYHFAQALAQAGFCISSGLALGIDAASHQGALSRQGKTIAVLGTGINSIYPRRHQPLAQQIIANGALISELPFNTQPKPENFPRRNRIISGLSIGTLIVEAAIRSGSLITARYALEQGREVFAIPNSIHNPLAKGCHALIRQGAKCVETVEHILEELNTMFIPTSHKPANTKKSLDIKQQKLVKCIGYEVTTIDTIIERSGFSAKEATALLPLIELAGCIRSIPGGYILV